MEVKYGVYKVVGSKPELVIAYGEPHVPMRTRRKYAGKKAKIKAIEQLTGNVLDAHLSTSEINAYIGQYILELLNGQSITDYLNILPVNWNKFRNQ